MEIISENELTQRNRFSATEKEYIDALIYVLNKHGIPESRYSLFGYGEACICLRKKGDDWEVYEGEREIKTNPVTVSSLKNACLEIISRVAEREKQSEIVYDFGRKVTEYSINRRIKYRTADARRKNNNSVATLNGVKGTWYWEANISPEKKQKSRPYTKKKGIVTNASSPARIRVGMPNED